MKRVGICFNCEFYTNLINSPIARIFLATLAFSWISIAQPLFAQVQEASLDGAVLTLPVVVVGDQLYRVELTLVANTEPLQFDLTAGEEIFGASSNGASIFSGNTLTIPMIRVADVSYWVALTLISQDPIRFVLADAGVNDSYTDSEQQALELFQSSLAQNVVQTRCVVCHVEGGLAGYTRLGFEVGADKTETNFDAFRNLLVTIDGGGDLLLDKVRGVSHGGGVQIAGNSLEFQDFSDFLTLLGNTESSGTVSLDNFYDAIILLSYEETLRKATELLQGRLATADEFNLVKNGDEATLRASLLGLMQGKSFKQFIRVNANDILLTDGVIGMEEAYQPNFYIDGHAVSDQVYLETGDEFLAENIRTSYVAGFVKRQPLELIIYVIQQDRPYTEILTADYIMVNPVINITYQAGAQFLDPDNDEEWQPGTINNYVIRNENTVFEVSDNFSFNGESLPVGGDLLDFPHAGILNTAAFLARYPSTATNRNRARARWTYMFFLGVDIEASAARTTDPVALADTNNPTLNNPNCTVCHELHDPVAGAFQNWSHDWGYYRKNTTDSLDEFYKEPEDGSITLYEPGDTWYRDMRLPGFGGNTAPDPDNSLQWLAQEIVNDPRFATASVKFWWSAVFGTKPLLAPEVSTDLDFQERLVAFEVENSLIDELAVGFEAGFSDFGPFNLKDLLAEMIMNPLFRARGLISTNEADSTAYASIGPGRILTPEMLQEKLENVLDYEWLGNLSNSGIYRYLYGGLDSVGVIERPKDYSTIMRAIIEQLGNTGSIELLGNEFIIEQADRLLFPHVELYTTPNTQYRNSFELSGDGVSARVVNSSTLSLPAGETYFTIKFENQVSGDGGAGDFSRLNVEAFVVRDDLNAVILSVDMSRPFETPGIEIPCGDFGSNDQGEDTHWALDACEIRVPIMLSKAGDYSLSVTVWPRQFGAMNVSYAIGADAGGDPRESTANGAQAIKQNIQLLVNRLWNKSWDVEHDEIRLAYQLWLDVYIGMQSFRVDNPPDAVTGSNVQPSAGTFPGGYEGWLEFQSLQKSYMESDTSYAQRVAWRGLISYLVSDFEFIYQ